MTQLERMKAAAKKSNPAPVATAATPAKTNAEKRKEPKPPKPEYLGLESVACDDCGTNHPLPINHDHWQFLKCKKPWPKKSKSPKRQKTQAERHDQRMGAKRLPHLSRFDCTYDDNKKQWKGMLHINGDTEGNGHPLFHGEHSGIFGLLISLDRKYREHLAAKFAPVTPKPSE
jgi:hypothetical protein